MVHNVGSYSSNIPSHEHNLANCVHKHSGGTLDAEMNIKTSGQVKEVQPAKKEPSLLELMTNWGKKVLGNGLHLLRGIWNEAADSGENSQISGAFKGMELQNGKSASVTLPEVNVAAMESVADVKVPLKKESSETENRKLEAVMPALKIKTGLARERFAAGKDAFLKKMKEMAQSRKKHSFNEKKEDRPGQQEKEMEWFEMSNAHLLDSYNKNGEYTNLGNRTEGYGYGGSPIKENYSKKA